MSERIAGGLSCVLVGFLLVGERTPTAGAQSRPARAIIDGVVTDTNLVSLPDATASILGSGIQVVTGANGRFRIVGVRAGQYIVVIRHIGYSPSSAVLHLADLDTLRVSFTLRPATAVLDTVLIAASHSSGRLTEFDERRALKQGQFMTEAEIDERGAVGTSDLLRTFLSVDVESGTAVNRRAGIARGCPYQFFVDGVAVPTPKVDRELPVPKDLAGIEVYANTALIPLQFKTFGGGAFCGAIVMWTKGGS